MSEHAPGPWVVWPSLYEGMTASVVRDVEPLETIAEVRAYANASLIAAAPDLLEALTELHLKAIVGTDEERHAALNAAWTAIQKATGE